MTTVEARTDQHRRYHLSTEELTSGLHHVRSAPRDEGTVELIVARPTYGERAVLPVGKLDLRVGLVGDTWGDRPSKRTADHSPHPDMQLNVISARLSALVAGNPDRRALAGDQLHLDLDLSEDNLPPGTRLRFTGDVAEDRSGPVIEVTDQPHTGCAKFVDRFGIDAMRFVNGHTGRALRLRGLNAKVVVPGAIRCGDTVVKL